MNYFSWILYWNERGGFVSHPGLSRSEKYRSDSFPNFPWTFQLWNFVWIFWAARYTLNIIVYAICLNAISFMNFQTFFTGFTWSMRWQMRATFGKEVILFSFYYTQPMAATIPKEREREKLIIFSAMLILWTCQNELKAFFLWVFLLNLFNFFSLFHCRFKFAPYSNGNLKCHHEMNNGQWPYERRLEEIWPLSECIREPVKKGKQETYKINNSWRYDPLHEIEIGIRKWNPLHLTDSKVAARNAHSLRATQWPIHACKMER